jgi:predicted transposase YbfD/YdcC
VPAPGAIDPEGGWPGPSAVGVTSPDRLDSRGRPSPEGRDYILSRRLSARGFAGAVRGHGGIENGLHRRSGVGLGEDAGRSRRDHAPADLSGIRRFSRGPLKRETSGRRGIEARRLKRASSDEYRERAPFNT